MSRTGQSSLQLNATSQPSVKTKTPDSNLQTFLTDAALEARDIGKECK